MTIVSARLEPNRIGARGAGVLGRAYSALLILLMVAGGFALWIAVPGAILWGLGALVEKPAEHLIAALLAVPSGMALFGIVLARLNAAYLRVNPADPPSRGGGPAAAPRGPLDLILALCAVIAFLALLAWMSFGEGPNGNISAW